LIRCIDCNWFNSHNCCACIANIEEEFSPTKGLQRYIKDSYFEWTSNKDGDCFWYKRKWWKFWAKKGRDGAFEPRQISSFMQFIKDKYPEILFEYEFLHKNIPVSTSTSRVKPTPIPTGGIKRTCG